MGSRSRSSNSSATSTTARQYTATDDAIIGNNNSRSETIVNDERVQIEDRSISTFTDNSDNSVRIETLSDDVALASINSSAVLASQLIEQASQRAAHAESASVAQAHEYAQKSAERDSQLTDFFAKQNAEVGAFVGDIVAGANETVAGISKTAAESDESNQKLLKYGAIGAAVLVGATLVLRG